MIEFLFLKAPDPRLTHYEPAMRELIEIESRKLGMANPAAYFAADNDFVLACDSGRLLGMTVVKQHRLKHVTYLGFRLVITHPDAARRGIFARMVTLYYLRALPSFIWQKLRHPGHQVRIYGDIATPIIYAKLARLGLQLYPDLVHGDTAAAAAAGRQLRASLVDDCGFRDMWQCPGVIRDVALDTGAISDRNLNGTSAYRHEVHARLDDGCDGAVDRNWALRWNAYVPPGADLLVIMPVNALSMAARIVGLLSFGFRRKKRRAVTANPLLIHTGA